MAVQMFVRNREVCAVRRTGKGQPERRVVALQVHVRKDHCFQEPCWSPDGARIAGAGRKGIRIQ